MRLLDAATQLIWAITPEALSVILDIAARQEVAPAVIEAAMHGTPDAVAARVGRPLNNARMAEVRDGIAVIPITGPIFRYANLFTEVSGATSVQVLAKDLHVALADPKVNGILLNIDSPGGEGNGIGELSDMIYAGRAVKPITAYVGGMGASAGYWLASAAGRIVTAEIAMLGSIGAIMAIPDPTKARGRDIEFISSVSPNKNPDPNLPDGQEQYQALVDRFGELFVAAVARNRGVKPQKVKDDFGAGGMLIGQDAVNAGLADSVGSFEGALSDMQTRAARAERAATKKIAAAQSPQGGMMGDRFDRWMAWLAGDAPDADAGTTGMVAMMSDGNTPVQSGTINSQAARTVAVDDSTITPARVQPSQADSNDRIRMAELEAENRRLKASMIHDRALVFAAEQVRLMKAYPAEQDTLVALYAQCAADDEQFGGVAAATGTTTRVVLLSALMASRPSASHLTADNLAPAVAEVLYNRSTSPKPGDDDLSDERRKKLLGASALGKTALNGRQHSN